MPVQLIAPKPAYGIERLFAAESSFRLNVATDLPQQAERGRRVNRHKPRTSEQRDKRTTRICVRNFVLGKEHAVLSRTIQYVARERDDPVREKDRAFLQPLEHLTSIPRASGQDLALQPCEKGVEYWMLTRRAKPPVEFRQIGENPGHRPRRRESKQLVGPSARSTVGFNTGLAEDMISKHVGHNPATFRASEKSALLDTSNGVTHFSRAAADLL